jgi:hypothetical protein
VKIVAGDARRRGVLHGDVHASASHMDGDLAVERRLQRSPGNGRPMLAIALPVEDDRARPVHGNVLAQRLHAARRPGRLIALTAGEFGQVGVLRVEPVLGGGGGQGQQLQQADVAGAARPPVLLISAHVFLCRRLALGAQQDADQLGPGGLQLRFPRERIGDAQIGVIPGNILQFAAPAARSDRQAPADLLERVAAAFFHADEPVGALEVAVAVETAHEVLEQWVVEGVVHGVEDFCSAASRRARRSISSSSCSTLSSICWSCAGENFFALISCHVLVATLAVVMDLLLSA